MSRFAGRGLDKLWFAFCAIHLVCVPMIRSEGDHHDHLLILPHCLGSQPISILLDMQTLYPAHWLQGTRLQAFFHWSISLARDPILGGAISGSREFTWLRYFLYLEGFFQVPCFAIGAWGLWRNDKRVYPLLLAYGASTATTLLPCLGAIFTSQPKPPFTTTEIATLLSEYIPFLLIPLGMAIDMAVKLTKIVAAAQERKAV
ncbi:hypothetical protein IAU60_006209 [Kwoniella sp. DSM 27419]